MNCLLCKNQSLNDVKSPYKYTTDSFRNLFPDLKVKKCEVCGLVQVDIDDTEETRSKLNDYYFSDYRGKTVVPSLNDENGFLYKRGRCIANILSKHITPSTTSVKVFEKGCGFGFNLLHIKTRFPASELYTDEPDEHAKTHLDKIGVEIVRGGV